MGKKKKKWYVVWKGRNTGVFTTWGECERQIKGFPGAKYKAFPSLAAAKEAFAGDASDFVGVGSKSKKKTATPLLDGLPDEVILPSWSVDAACSGNPGIMEYQCVDTKTGEVIFAKGPFSPGTNNIGEFLALAHALALLVKEGNTQPVYTDSRTAMAWVRNKRVKTTLERQAANEDMFGLVDRAIRWLQTNTYPNRVIKWNTEEWGEIPADFGRK